MGSKLRSATVDVPVNPDFMYQSVPAEVIADENGDVHIYMSSHALSSHIRTRVLNGQLDSIALEFRGNAR